LNKLKKYQILLTNDDGIQSPGLWAAAEALGALGYVTVAAPREQSSGAGRSLPVEFDGRIEPSKLTVNGQDWTVYAVGGTPTAAVMHAVLELLPHKPDLVVSGINYGENPGTDITMSGTVGAAIEGAALGIPSMAVSLQLKDVLTDYLSYSNTIDFSAAGHFTRLVGELLLEKRFPHGVDLVNVNVPRDATPETSWRITCLADYRYFKPYVEREGGFDTQTKVLADITVHPGEVSPESDIQAFLFDKVVSVTPLTLDMTARVDLRELEKQLKTKPH
jgi:5'-nucleotidase